ncbi:MAG: fibronectin type III domain-containing protein, partial [Caulobacteraceae bacterium]|nr:fibronectin type III domain-containing protein [Caulobacteraceae bacterium]
GIGWNRYPKRAVRIESNRIIFYSTKPDWAATVTASDYDNFTLETILEEFGIGDTIALVNAETLDVIYVKPAISVSFAAIDQDPNTSFEDYVTDITFSEVLTEGDNPTTLTGYVMEVCPGTNLPDEGTFVRAYAFSVKKGGYLDMKLEPDAKDSFTCGTDPTSLTFKPSTVNTISIRPNIHTTFNSLAENIDFIIFGKTSTPLDSYNPLLFDLNENNVPVGLIAGFKVDANIPNAVSGTMSSGVIFSQFLDRNKTIPTGYFVDETAKICINRNNAYAISSIASGTGSLTHYASLSVSGVTYSDQLLAQEIYLTPKPNSGGTGKYVANALLTVNSAGQIVSRVSSTNPTVPSPPINLTLIINGNNECTLDWEDGEDGGRQIINYIVEFSANNGSSWTAVSEDNLLRYSKSTSCTVVNLQVSVSYMFRVKAQNSVGIGNPSSSVSYIPNYNLPQAPANLSYNRSFGDTLSIIALSWSSPASEGSSAISGYVIEESENNGITWIYHNTIDSLITSTSETIYGLSNSSDYLYRVSAINQYGQGTYNFVYASGNVIPVSIEDQEQQQEQEDVLSNWDFGVVLFTGVCQ